MSLVLAARVVAGIALRADRATGLTLCMRVQLAPLVRFVTGDLTFRIGASGCRLADLFLRAPHEDGWPEDAWAFDAAHDGPYAFAFAVHGDLTAALNLVALAILIWLALRRRVRRTKTRTGHAPR